LPAASWALNTQHVEPADESTDRSIAGHARHCIGGFGGPQRRHPAAR
jgi:hypothetical protein